MQVQNFFLIASPAMIPPVTLAGSTVASNLLSAAGESKLVIVYKFPYDEQDDQGSCNTQYPIEHMLYINENGSGCSVRRLGVSAGSVREAGSIPCIAAVTTIGSIRSVGKEFISGHSVLCI